ncbi:hypothetical protein L1049_018980 [Liquidambar formosana]|uniref:Uncharacterized protein n=1 Tax=Liquidambar formosana TaxID=63359 RepID=A0AAP0WNU5_LIQFO
MVVGEQIEERRTERRVRGGVFKSVAEDTGVDVDGESATEIPTADETILSSPPSMSTGEPRFASSLTHEPRPLLPFDGGSFPDIDEVDEDDDDDDDDMTLADE